jgi:hypothetical protein
LIQTDLNNSIKVSKEPDKTPHLSSQVIKDRSFEHSIIEK